MNCHEYADAIVELARGEDREPALAGLGDHLHRCGSCMRFYEQQRTLTAGLRALSAAAIDSRPSQALEADLLDAFAALHGRGAAALGVPGRVASTWLPIAAALALATTALVWQAHMRSREPQMFRPQGFVALPTAATLPALERGEIVRMEIPAAALPAYGIDMPLGVGRTPVQADVLVGQDGLPRAIRLVTDEYQE
jgi:hypothetical protein